VSAQIAGLIWHKRGTLRPMFQWEQQDLSLRLINVFNCCRICGMVTEAQCSLLSTDRIHFPFPICDRMQPQNKLAIVTEHQPTFYESLQVQRLAAALLFTDSRSHILSAPDKDPAITVSSELLNFTASTGLVWPDRLCRYNRPHQSYAQRMTMQLSLHYSECQTCASLKLFNLTCSLYDATQHIFAMALKRWEMEEEGEG